MELINGLVFILIFILIGVLFSKIFKLLGAKIFKFLQIFLGYFNKKL